MLSAFRIVCCVVTEAYRVAIAVGRRFEFSLCGLVVIKICLPSIDVFGDDRRRRNLRALDD